MKITASDLKGFGIVDEIIAEPPGGAHVDHERAFVSLDRVLERQLADLEGLDIPSLLEARYQKYRNMGRLGREFVELTP